MPLLETSGSLKHKRGDVKRTATIAFCTQETASGDTLEARGFCLVGSLTRGGAESRSTNQRKEIVPEATKTYG